MKLESTTASKILYLLNQDDNYKHFELLVLDVSRVLNVSLPECTRPPAGVLTTLKQAEITQPDLDQDELPVVRFVAPLVTSLRVEATLRHYTTQDAYKRLHVQVA